MQLNLNLLTILDALLEEGSVMGAADRMQLSQPAMSRALGRLRRLTGDEILVRSGRTMTPTPYAVGVHERVHEILQQATDVLTPRRQLELNTLDRTFTIRSHDLLIGIVSADLHEAIADDAPGVRLRFLAEPAVDASELQRGRVDLELSGTTPSTADISFEVLGAGRMGVALARDHPLGTGELTAARFAAAHHVMVSRRGRLHDQIDDALSALALKRRVVTVVPTTADALLIVQQSETIATIPLEASRELIERFGLVPRELPLNVPPALAISSWHQRYDSDPAHQWLRGRVRSAFTRAYAATPDPPPEE